MVGVKPGVTVLCFLGKCRSVSDRLCIEILKYLVQSWVNVCSETQDFGSCLYHVSFMFQIQDESCKGIS